MQGDPRDRMRHAFWFWLAVAAMVLAPPWWLWFPLWAAICGAETAILRSLERARERRQLAHEHALDAQILAAANAR